jgi:hypothetical protein
MYAVGTMKEVICYKHCWLFTLANQILQDYLGPLPS